MEDFEWYRYRRRRIAAFSLGLLLADDERASKRGKARQWIKRRQEKGFFANIVQELMVEDVAGYREMFLMKPADFHTILRRVKYIEADITSHQILGGNKVVTPPERLALALRFLATGETYRSLSFQFRISKAAISYIIKHVCDAIVKHMGPHFLKVPSPPEEWLAVANKFKQKWQYPNCIGAIDGKHIIMQPPPNAGSYFYNYKHSHSVVLMAVAGPDYQCLYADVGTNGRISDGGVWNKCGLAAAMKDGSLSLPPHKCLPFGTKLFPHVLVGDDAFALKPYLMKPFPQQGLTTQKRVYNYRHSRARRISENLFGILANRWCVFKSIMQIPPETIDVVVMAALTLHNYLRNSCSKELYFTQLV
ncbi:uncharacterized protein [Montipora capricornis]|uniref:uncharacterized protein n=1 Tax=Montipora capricornis TaxID=246305 RepID=UPI0035F17732